jgi:CHASE2 domain-containing sensor protein
MSASSLLQSSGRQRIIEAVVAVLALVALWLLSFTPQWRQLEFKTFDAYTALAARGPGDTPVVIVAIDEPSFRELGLHWPFPWRTHAELIGRAASDGARVIAFDVLFAEATNAVDDGRMVDAIRHARNVVLAKTREKSQTSVGREWTLVEPLPVLVEAGARTGEVGVIRARISWCGGGRRSRTASTARSCVARMGRMPQQRRMLRRRSSATRCRTEVFPPFTITRP